MQSALLGNSKGRAFTVRFRAGEEICAGIAAFATEYNMANAAISGVGNLSRCRFAASGETAGSVSGQALILQLDGFVMPADPAPAVWIAAMIADDTGAVTGGSLREAVVQDVAEIILSELTEERRRTPHAPSGVPLLKHYPPSA